MRNFLWITISILLFINCKKDKSPTKIDVSKIPVTVALDRFDVDFYTASTKDLPAVQQKYPLLFPRNVHDSVWFGKMKDTDEQELFSETQKVFKNIASLQKELTSLFKHVKYYNPKFKEPKIITMLTNIDYEHRITYADSLLLISLDAYLGANHEFYGSYPAYVKQNNRKEHIVVDVATTIIGKQVLPNRSRTFLGKMIDEGKKMYLLDAYLPAISDEEKIGYTVEKMRWAQDNEEQIWKYFIEKNLLYDTSAKLNQRFLEVAPFSKFYLGEDNLSPGRIGVWMGWQIVRSFMKKNGVSLPQLLQMNEEELFKKSNYKPRR